jgi:autotransporter-associated beta strand protein
MFDKKTQLLRSLRLLGASLLTLAAANGQLKAQTIWDGGATPDNNINTPANWDNDIANLLNASQNATFSTGGTNATLNVNAKFRSVTFNNPAGFTINGPGTLTVTNSVGSGAPNVIVSSAQNAGPTVITAPFTVETGTAGTKLLNIQNNSTFGGAGLVFSNSVSASNPATNYAFRLQGSGLTKFYGAISNCSAIQPASAANSGTNVFAGNQVLGTTTTVNIPGTTTATSGSSVRIQMGESPTDIQSWGSTLISQLGTVAINSTATLSGGVSNSTAASSGVSGAVLEVNGNLSATALSLGGSLYFGTVKLGGRAYFSGPITIGATAGNTIIGIASTNATLALSSGTISSSVTIGGANPNENNIEIVKTNAGTLNLGGTHTYTGATLVKGGALNLNGTLNSPITVSPGASIGGEGSTSAGLTFAPGTINFNFDPSTVGALTASNIVATGATLIISPSVAGTGIVFQATAPAGISGTVGGNFILGSRGGNLALDPAGSTLWFTNGVAAPANLKWVGNAANPTFWDVVTTTNWSNGGSVDRYYAGDNVLFDDTASSYLVAQQVASVGPASTVVSNSSNAYVLTNSTIIGTGSFTKYGAANLTVYGGGHSFQGGLTINGGTVSLIGAANTFTGGITNNGGLLVISNINQIGANTGSTASSNLVVLNGGGLSYIGPTITSDTLTFQLAGGTSTINVDSGTTNLFTLRSGAAVTGPGNLIKSGTGTLALGRNTTQDPLGNTFTGKITVTAGELDIRQSDSLGDVSGITEITNATLYIDPFGQSTGMTFDAEPLVFSGESFIRNYNQGTLNAQVNVLQGAITNNGILNIYSQTNGAYGELQINGVIENAAATTLRFGRAISNNAVAAANMNQFVTVNGSINGPASVYAEGKPGSIYTLANNNYSGNTTVTGGKLALGQATLATNSIVTVSNAVLELNFSGLTNTIGGLVLNGVTQTAGVYSSNTHPALIGGDGSLLVAPVSTIASNPTNITFTASGGSLNLSWPASHLGWILQAQTNSRAVGLTTPTNTWFDVAGSASLTNTSITISPADPTVFFRLRKP